LGQGELTFELDTPGNASFANSGESISSGAAEAFVGLFGLPAATPTSP
jgi:hypothetical protein